MARLGRAAIGEILLQRAELTHERQQLLLVVGAHRLLERALVDRLGQQLGQVAADIVAHLAHPHRLAAERRLVVQQGVAVVVDDHLQRDAELLAIAEHGLVVVRQPRRADIEIEIVGTRPFHGLGGVDLFDAFAAADRPIAPAGARSRLQDHALVTRLRELIGGRHSGDAGAQNDHAGPAPRAARQRWRARMRRRDHQQAHRRHGIVGGGDAAGLADEVDEAPPRERGTQAAIRHAYLSLRCHLSVAGARVRIMRDLRQENVARGGRSQRLSSFCPARRNFSGSTASPRTRVS